MAKNYFNRYVWLIDLIRRRGPIPFEDISHAWAHSSLNSGNSATQQESKLPQRTFFNHIDAIFDTFGIEIKCDRSRGYYLADSGDTEGAGVRNWLLESLSMNNLLSESRNMRDRILFEKIPSSQKWLPVIIDAMRDGTAIELTYQSFWRDEPNTFEVHPWCVKLFKQRWYMLAKSEGYDAPRIYALDERMLDAVPLKKRLRIPAKFNAEEFFSHYFGVIAAEGKPEFVDLKVDADQVRYFESLPLHASQEKIAEEEDFTVFRYCLVPTFDFKQELLGRGPSVEVLAPAWFREEIAEDIKEMTARYERFCSH